MGGLLRLANVLGRQNDFRAAQKDTRRKATPQFTL